MVSHLQHRLEIILQDIQNVQFSPREPIPSWAAKLVTPTFLAVAILTTLPSPGPVRVTVGLTAFTSLWLHVVTHLVAGPAFFMDAVFMISITARWILLFVMGTPETDYYQTSKTATRLERNPGSPWYWRFLYKAKWSVELWSCWRGQGWNFVDQHLGKGAEQTQSHRSALPSFRSVTYNVINKANGTVNLSSPMQDESF